MKYLSKYIFADSVNQPNSGKLAFVMKSDPTKQDSDEDGLEDMYDPPTLIFNVIYNRNNAIEYALTWTGDGSNEIYNDEYYHRGADCANFVSQCVYYGGYVMNSEWFMTRFKDETITLPQEKILSKFKGTYTENGWEWFINWIRAKELYDYMSNENSSKVIEIPLDLTQQKTYYDEIIKNLLLNNTIKKGDLLFRSY